MIEWQLPAALLKLLIDLSLKGGSLLLLAVMTVRVLRRGSADQRYTTLTLIFHGLLLLPLLLPVHPIWQVPLLPEGLSGWATLSLPEPFRGSAGAHLGPLLLVSAWCLGFVVVLVRLGRGLIAVSMLRRSARPIRDSRWQAALEDVRRHVGVRSAVQLLEQRSIPTALAVGILRPAILLPGGAAAWSESRRRAILTHEMIHHRRRDNLTNLVVHVVCALHWFNPLVWWASRQLRSDRERACDDAVLRCGTRPSDYVESLLSFVPRPRPLRSSLEMGHASALKTRLRAILDPAQRRTPVGWLRSLSHLAAVIAIVACLALLDLWLPAPLTDGVRSPFQLLARAAFTSGGFEASATPGAAPGLEMAALESRPAAGDRSHPVAAIEAERHPSQGLLKRTWSRVRRVFSSRSADSSMATESAAFSRSLPFPLPRPSDRSDDPGGRPQPPARSVTQIDLGTLGGDSSTATALNEFGQVVGFSSTEDGRQEAFVWSVDTGMERVVLPPMLEAAEAVAINDRGDVLVRASDAGVRTSYVWSPGRGSKPVTGFGPGSTEALVINERGEVGGRAEVEPGRVRAFYWNPETGPINLGGQEVVAINNSGLAVARADSFSYVWQEDIGFVRIGDVGVRAIPFDVNNRGEVVGTATSPGRTTPYAFIWSQEDGFTDLGAVVGGADVSIAYRINDSGQVVGVVRSGVPVAATGPVGESVVPFLWSREGGLVQLDARIAAGVLLNDLGHLVGQSVIPIGTGRTSALFWSRELGSIQLREQVEAELRAEPIALNNRGQVVGNFVSADGTVSRAFLWQLQLPAPR